MEKIINKAVPILIASLAAYVWLDGYYAFATIAVGMLLSIFHTFLATVFLGGAMLSVYPFVRQYLSDGQSVTYMNIAFICFAFGIVCESVRMIFKLPFDASEEHHQGKLTHEKQIRMMGKSSLYRFVWYIIGVLAIIAGVISNVVVK